MSVNELIQICFAHELDGKQTDTCVRSIAVNLLKPTKPVVSIQMDTIDNLLHMTRGADHVHILITGGVFHFNAFYSVTEKFPAPRIYFMKTPDLMQVAKWGVYLEKQKLKFPPIDGQRFSQLIEEESYPTRYAQWHKRWTANSRQFKGLFDGRLQNTSVEKGIWLSSEGGCLICGGRTNSMCTATLIGKTGLIIGLQLCQLHENEAQNHSTLFEFISSKMGVPASFLAGAKVTLHQDQILAMSCAAIRNELECEIDKVEANTITAIRRSGFRLILRQDTLTDYAYNIQDPHWKPISRIDSANHHDVEYGPDHVHHNLSKRKKNIVEPSFTYGFAVADLKAIRRLVEDAESHWN